MNETEKTIYKVLDIVVEECSQSFLPITHKEVIGRGGNEQVRMARCIFVTQLLLLGYNDIVVYRFIGRTRQALEDMPNRSREYRKVSWAYRQMYDACSKRCEQFQTDRA